MLFPQLCVTPSLQILFLSLLIVIYLSFLKHYKLHVGYVFHYMIIIMQHHSHDWDSLLISYPTHTVSCKPTYPVDSTNGEFVRQNMIRNGIARLGSQRSLKKVITGWLIDSWHITKMAYGKRDCFIYNINWDVTKIFKMLLTS